MHRHDCYIWHLIVVEPSPEGHIWLFDNQFINFHNCLSYWRLMGGLELIAAVMGERPNTKTSSYAQIHTYVQFRTTNYLTCMYLNCGKKPVYPQTSHSGRGRTCKLHTVQWPLLNWATSCLNWTYTLSMQHIQC